MVCLFVAFVTTLLAISIVKWMPYGTSKRTSNIEKKGDVEEIILKAIFSTDYLLGNDSQTPEINNIDGISDQLNKTLNGKQIEVLGAFFLLPAESQRMKCPNQLLGEVLQVDFRALTVGECSKEEKCQTQFREELRETFNQLVTIPILIQLNNNLSQTININLCNLDKLMDTETTPKSRAITLKVGRNYPLNRAGRRNSRCSLCINKIGVVQLNGEYGSRINDDIRGDLYFDPREYRTASLYEEKIYRLNVQLDCGGKPARDSYTNPCSRSLSVTVWIDYNDNQYDDSESRILHRAWSNGNSPTGNYFLDIRVPAIDRRSTKSGIHQMRLTVSPSEEYQRECGTMLYQETIEYTINIIPKPRPIVITRPPVISRDPICFRRIAQIILVLMAGEKGTEIRDDIPRYSLPKSLPNEHHLAVTLFEQTIYLIRIQLDCSTQSSTDLTPRGCNLIQDVIVFIDRNDDGIFDQSESSTPYTWPTTSYLPQGIYDLQVYVPFIGDQPMRSGTHRMRVLVRPSAYFLHTCGYSEYSEIRDYTVNIIPRSRYSSLIDVVTPPTIIDDIQCSSDIGKLVLVVMAGEYRTQIRDDPSTTAAIAIADRIEEHRSIILYEDTVYLLRIQLECIRPRGKEFFRVNCTLPHDVSAWIDLNDDGKFDPSENAAPYRWPISSYIPDGIYDLQISLPFLNEGTRKSGPHRMHLTISPNQQYQDKCGGQSYTETRDYNVTIVKYKTNLGDIGLPSLALNENACSQENAQIVLVIMTGVLGTHIRDDTPLNTLIPTNQNRHHLSVTLYENTVYRIRIQLDCRKSSSRSDYDIKCNHAQDVNILIDLNNDGIYDQSESQIDHRWPLQNSMGLGIYDIDVTLPTIDGRNNQGGAHRMRVVVTLSEEYQTKCGQNNHQEIREYTINIIPRTTVNPIRRAAIGELRRTCCLPGNFRCSNGNSAIYSVKLLGEEFTHIDDKAKECSLSNNYYDHRDMIATLYDNTVYTITVQLFCVQEWGYRNLYHSDLSLFQSVCTRNHHLNVWIDLNNDGVFDENTEHITSTNRYENAHRRAEYHLQITIPTVTRRNYLNVQHRMRLILSSDQSHPKPCDNVGYGEARDYTIQTLPKLRI